MCSDSAPLLSEGLKGFPYEEMAGTEAWNIWELHYTSIMWADSEDRFFLWNTVVYVSQGEGKTEPSGCTNMCRNNVIMTETIMPVKERLTTNASWDDFTISSCENSAHQSTQYFSIFKYMYNHIPPPV